MAMLNIEKNDEIAENPWEIGPIQLRAAADGDDITIFMSRAGTPPDVDSDIFLYIDPLRIDEARKLAAELFEAAKEAEEWLRPKGP